MEPQQTQNPVMDVTAPPAPPAPVVEDETVAEAPPEPFAETKPDSQPEPEPAKPAEPLKQTTPKPGSTGNGVALAIVATVIIVLGLAVIAFYAYTKQS